VSLLPLRSLYFFNFAAMGALFPFLPLLLARRGLNPLEISWVMVLVPATGLVVPSVVGALADVLRGRTMLLRLSLVASALSALTLLPPAGLLGSAAALGLLSFFRAPVLSLADAAVYDMSGGSDSEFSRVRVFGSLGFAISAFALGRLDASEHPGILIPAAAIALGLAALSTLALPAARLEPQKGVLADVRRVIASRSMLLFLAGTCCYYTAHSCFDVYFGLHVAALGHDDQFVGSCWATAVVTEVLLLALAPRFLDRMSTRGWLVTCGLVSAGRWAVLGLCSDSLSILAVQPLHGVTFGIWYLALVKHVQRRAPSHLRTSLQGVAMSCVGAGMICGYLLGGALMYRFDGFMVYRVAAAVSVLASLVYFASGRSPGKDGRGEGV